MYTCVSNSKSIRLEVSEEQYERLSELKDRKGLTWKGLVLEGEKHIREQAHGEQEDYYGQ